MTAPALNTAQFVPTAGGNAGTSAGATPGGDDGAFGALMAALFPQAQSPIAPAAAGASTTELVETDEAATEEASDAVLAGQGEGTTDEAATELASSLQGAQAPVTQPAEAKAKDTAATAPAWGRDKAKGTPAQPALLHANAKADLAGKFEAAPEASEDGGQTETPIGGEQQAPRATPQLPPQASAQARAATQTPPPAQAATQTSDTPDAPPPANVAEADVPEAAPSPLQNTAASQQATTAAGLAPRAEAAQAQPVRSAKAERRAGVEDAGASDLKPLEASEKPVFAKAASSTAKHTAANVETSEPKVAEAEVQSDEPDAIQPAEARAAGQSSAAAAHASQAVRGSPETVAALAAQIIKKLEGKSTRFDVELDPAGLGKVDVRVEIGAHGRLVASLAFENPQAAQDLKARSAELQRALEQAGFDLSGGLSFDVAGDRRQGQAWQEQAGDNRAFQGRAFRQALDTAGDADAAATQGALRLRRGVSAGLDLRI